MAFNWKFGKESVEAVKFSPFSANFPEGHVFRVGEALTSEDVESLASRVDGLIEYGYLSVDRLIAVIEKFDSKEEFAHFIFGAKRMSTICIVLEEKGIFFDEIDSIKKNLGLVDTHFLFEDLYSKLQKLHPEECKRAYKIWH